MKLVVTLRQTLRVGLRKTLRNQSLDLSQVKLRQRDVQVGHAGAIVGGHDDTAEAKKRIMRDCGIHVVDSPAHIGMKMAEILGVTA